MHLKFHRLLNRKVRIRRKSFHSLTLKDNSRQNLCNPNILNDQTTMLLSIKHNQLERLRPQICDTCEQIH